jgi:hypothetical protein
MPTPAFVQTNYNNTSPGTSVSVTFSSPNTAGNFIIVLCSIGSGGSPHTMSDTAGNTYTAAVTAYAGQTIYYAQNINASASNTVTFTDLSSDYLVLCVAEFSGLPTTGNPVDGSTLTTTGTSTSPSGNLTTSAANDVIFGTITGGAGLGKGSAYTLLMNFNFGGQIAEYQIPSSTGTIPVTFTSASGTWYIAAVAFLAATGGGGGGGSTTTASQLQGSLVARKMG